MSYNPYQPPSHTDEPPSRQGVANSTVRPVSVTIFAVLFLCHGGIGLVATAITSRNLINSDVSQSMDGMGVPSWLILSGMLIYTSMSGVAGLGMLAGATWGWWIAAFSCLYSIALQSEGIVRVVGFTDEVGNSVDDFPTQTLNFIGRNGVSLFVLLYLYDENVRDYFDVFDLSWWKSLGLLIALISVFYIALIILVTLVST